jgi:hypothetical protein
MGGTRLAQEVLLGSNAAKRFARFDRGNDWILREGISVVKERRIAMLELELATTEQIIAELAKRPNEFVLVCVPTGELKAEDGYIAFSPHLAREDVRAMLDRASRILAHQGDSHHNCGWQDQDCE